MNQFQPQPTVNQTPDPRLMDGIIRRRLSRVGWGVLLYLVTTQVLGGILIMIPGVRNSIYLTLAVNEVVSYGLGPLVLWLLIRSLPKGPRQGLKLSPRAFVRTALFCLGILYLFNLLTTLLMLGIETLSGSSTGNLLESVADTAPTWAYLVMVGLIAPVMEELIFRQLLLDRLRPFGDRAAILISGVAFGLFHMNLYQFFYATALGLALGGIALKTGKIWHTMLLHAIINLSSPALNALISWGNLGATVGNILVWVFMGLAVFFFYRYAKTFRYLPPAPPVTNRQVFRNLLRSPGTWVCTVLLLAASVAVVFLV